MNARSVTILIVLLIVLGGGALLVQQQQSEREAANLATLGQPVLKDLKAAEVTALRIQAPDATLSIAQKNGRWTIAERNDFPADLDTLRAFVLKAIELKVGQSEPIGDKDRVRIALNEAGEGAGTLVTFGGADGKALAQLIVGKNYFKQPPNDAQNAKADGRFVMRPADPKTVLIVSDPLEQVTPQTARWIDRRGLAAEGVKTLEARLADGSHWKIARAHDDADWTLEGEIPNDQQVAVTKGNAASYSMSLLEIADVAPPGMAPAATGLDKPSIVTASTFDGLTYTLKIGKLVDGKHYVAATIDGEPVKTRTPVPNENAKVQLRRDKEHAERLANLAERLPREKALTAHVLLIDKIKLDDVLQQRSIFLEKKTVKK
jgi:hypothetical protein